MKIQIISLVFFIELAAAQVPILRAPDTRIINGIEVDTLDRFPFHVTIQNRNSTAVNGTSRYCSGSLIGHSWILTTHSCISGATDIEIQFRRRYLNSIEGSYSLVVGPSAVTSYPTDYEGDDLALIHLPAMINCDNELQTIQLYRSGPISDLRVMAGFGEDRYKLAYGWYKENENCKSWYGSRFDEFNHICAIGYSKGEHAPCAGNEGGGLVIGWPKKPLLLGVFSKYVKPCRNGYPSIFINVSKYLTWIQGVTNNQVRAF